MTILFHVGYHKTASSWLQQRFFVDQSNSFELVGAKNREARQKIVWPSPLQFIADDVREHYAEQLQIINSRGGSAVFSDERYSGNPFSGGFDSKEIANRIHQTFPETRILIVVREQREMIYSTYDEYIREGGACSLMNFLRPKTRYCTPMFRFTHFEYDHLAQYYARLFRPENLLVLPFEMFKEDGTQFLSRIAQFCGASAGSLPDLAETVNPSRPTALLGIQRRLNPFLVRDDLNANSIFAVPRARYYLLPWIQRVARLVPQTINHALKSKMQSAIQREVKDMYGDSNRKLQTMVDFDLARYGYDVGPGSLTTGSTGKSKTVTENCDDKAACQRVNH